MARFAELCIAAAVPPVSIVQWSGKLNGACALCGAASMPRAQSADSLAGAVATGDAEAATRNTAEHAGMAVHDPPPDMLSAMAADACSRGGDYSNYGSNGFVRCQPRRDSYAQSIVSVPWPPCCCHLFQWQQRGAACGKSTA